MSDRPAETEYSALQALLQIRTNQSSDGTSNSAGGARENPNLGKNSCSSTANGGANNHSDIVNLIRMSGNPASFLQHAQMNYSSAQLAALTATMQSPGGGLYPSSALQSPSFSANTLHSPFQQVTSPLAAAPGPMSPSIELPGSPALSPLRPAPQGTFNSAHSNHGAMQDGEEQAEKKIRKDEVEAALRSKPQRGRKRENLNAEERLELTRTRNREHAKSTRIRKKARYQELLDTEQKYLELTNSQHLESQRRQAVLGFLELRATVLSNRFQNDKECSAPSYSANDEDRKGNENRSISFDHTETLKEDNSTNEGPEATNATNPEQDDTAKKVKDFIVDEESFEFESPMAATSRGVDAMACFDESIGRGLEQFLGSDASPQLQYRVAGSTEGIAINDSGSAFARVDLVLTNNDHKSDASGEEERVLLSSLISLDFRKDSNRIQSVGWSILKDAMVASGSESGNESKSAQESLESQVVYPSVVSFDEAQREKARDRLLDAIQTERQESEDHGEDHGMSF